MTQCFHFDSLVAGSSGNVVGEFPETEVVAGGGEEVGGGFARTEGFPEDFCDGIFVVCFSDFDEVVGRIRTQFRLSISQWIQSQNL